MVIHLDNKDNETEVYHEDNSFNNQGIEPVQSDEAQDEQMQIPDQRKGGALNNARDFAHGFKEGVKNGLNPTENNPALGIHKKAKKNTNNKNKNQQGNKDSAKGQQDNQVRKNPLPGGGLGDPVKRKRQQDNINNANNKNKQNQQNKNGKNGDNKKGGLASRLNPINRRRQMLGGLGGKGAKGGASKEGASQVGKALLSGLKTLWMALPIQVKLGIALGLVFIIAAFTIIAILGSTTAMIVVAACSSTDYDVNGSDTTSFLCNMQSPFGDNEYTVSGTSGWRWHPVYNEPRFHKGTDLYVSGSDKSVYAVQSGTVIATGYDGGAGNYVTIEHDNGFITKYFHFSSVASGIEVGSTVQAGDKIGNQGSTGASTGDHLHFELLDANGNYLSANPFFGYSDQGYEQCIDPDASYDPGCEFDITASARAIGQDGFNQICGRTGNYTNGGSTECCGTESTGDLNSLIQFINGFEASNPTTCSTASGKLGYRAENLGDGAVTAGYGVTNAPVRSSTGQTIIRESGLASDFAISGGKYIMRVGGCYPKSVIDDIQKASIENDYGAEVTTSAQKYNVNLSQYEKDALTSFNYNLGTGYIDQLVSAYKNDGYEGLWDAMKDYIHSDGKALDGLRKRRKAEFALFVTGDYTDQGLFYSRNLTNYDDYDSENVMARKATGSASVCAPVNGDKSNVIEIAIRELEANSGASNSQKCSYIKTYMQACGYTSGVHHYCAGFVTYVLEQAGVAESIGLPSYSCTVSSFKNTENGEWHDAGKSYIPEAGDIAITSGWGHVQFVEKVEGKTVHFLGGNQSPFNVSCPNNGAGSSLGNVTRYTASLDSSLIVGYISY